MKSVTLGIDGGSPVRDTLLPYGKQWVDREDVQAVVDVLNGDFLTTGPAIAQFEKAVAQYVDAKYAVAFSNGTAALHAACFAAGIGLGDEVITTPMTFAASANCVLYMGGTPVFADINETYNIDPDKIKALITPKTKAIIPVHFTGQPVDLEEIHKIAKEHQLIVIEDAAHALGSTYKDKKIGALSDMTMFSFHPVKHITTGEGGIITTNNADFYQKLLQFRSHGITRDTSMLERDDQGAWYYEMQFLGYNYRLTDFQAALGKSQLTKLDRFVSIRQKYAGIYNESFKKIKQLQIPPQSKHAQSSWHLYIIKLNLNMLKCGRKEIFDALLKENIGVNVHYIPVYYHPYYQKLGYKKSICPNAERLYEEIISLPIFPGMSEKDVHDVIEAVNKVIGYYSK